MNENSKKITLIIVGAVILITLVAFIYLIGNRFRKNSSDNNAQSQLTEQEMLNSVSAHENAQTKNKEQIDAEKEILRSLTAPDEKNSEPQSVDNEMIELLSSPVK